MLRIALVSILAILVAAGAIAFASGQSTETPLGQCSAGSDTLSVILREGSDGKTALAISVGSASSRQSFNLQMPCPPQMEKALVEPLKISAVDAADANSVVAEFATKGATGEMQFISMWLHKTSGRWELRGEWSVEKFNHQELGEKTETQAFAFESGGILRRCAIRNTMEGIKTTCEQGCCVTWQSKTLVTQELETLGWNGATHAAERQTFQKWYVTQYGDGLMSIAKKVFNDPSRMTTLLRLNPALQNQEKLEENQRVLVDSVGVKQ